MSLNDSTDTPDQATAGTTPTGRAQRPRPASMDSAQVEQVVALLDVVYRANGLLADELDRLVSARASVNQTTVTGLLRLAEGLRPGAAAHAQLAALDPEVQLAGAGEWIARRRRVDPQADLLPAPRLAAGAEHQRHAQVELLPPVVAVSAVSRARRRWHLEAGQ